MSQRKKDKIFYIILVSPLIIYILGFTLAPVLQTFIMSFQDKATQSFTFSNYTYIIKHFQFNETKIADLNYEVINKKQNITYSTNYNIDNNIDLNNDKNTSDNTKSIHEKIEALSYNLHTNNVCDKKSACFWCTYDFDNTPIYIPKYELYTETDSSGKKIIFGGYGPRFFNMRGQDQFQNILNTFFLNLYQYR